MKYSLFQSYSAKKYFWQNVRHFVARHTYVWRDARDQMSCKRFLFKTGIALKADVFQRQFRRVAAEAAMEPFLLKDSRIEKFLSFQW